ncbi:unnamed protein product [Rhizophagus irregularis]|nr:unnamed protein product [Rhizophagus irregularis]
MEIIAILSVNYVTDIQKELYNKYYSIMVLCETRWNSHFYCFKSLIQSKQALRNLAIRHERSQSTPAEASTSTSNNTNEIYLNKDILRKNDRTIRKTVESMGVAITFAFIYAPSKFQKRPTRLLLDFEDYRQKIEPFDDETFGQFGGDVFKFWKYIEGDYKELASIALRIFGICNDKVLSMSKLRASINFSFRKKELQKNEVEFFDLNTKPVDDSAENLQKNPIDDEEITGDENIITSEQEEVSRLEEEEALRDNPGSLRGDLLTEYIHPAIDTRAKWDLKTLFSSVIDIPKYLSNESI